MAPQGPIVAVICKLQISIRNWYLIIHPFLALLFQRFISTTLESKETEFYHISKSRKPSIAFICCRPTRNSRQCLLIAWLPTSTNSASIKLPLLQTPLVQENCDPPRPQLPGALIHNTCAISQPIGIDRLLIGHRDAAIPFTQGSIHPNTLGNNGFSQSQRLDPSVIDDSTT